MSLPNTIEFEVEIKTELKGLEVDLKTELSFTVDLNTTITDDVVVITELNNLMVQI